MAGSQTGLSIFFGLGNKAVSLMHIDTKDNCITDCREELIDGGFLGPILIFKISNNLISVDIYYSCYFGATYGFSLTI